jgi:hypothetical protein
MMALTTLILWTHMSRLCSDESATRWGRKHRTPDTICAQIQTLHRRESRKVGAECGEIICTHNGHCKVGGQKARQVAHVMRTHQASQLNPHLNALQVG